MRSIGKPRQRALSSHFSGDPGVDWDGNLPPMAPGVIRGIQIVVTWAACDPAILKVGKANGAVTAAAVDFNNWLPRVATVGGRQEDSFATPMGDGRFYVHPAVSGIEEEDLARRDPPNAFRQCIEVLDCPVRA